MMEASKKDNVRVSHKEWLEQAILDHLCCCLCGTQLKFQHKVDHIRRLVTEDAHCERCGVKHRSIMHPMQ